MTREESLEWLERSCMPLWLDRGLDRERGGFVENLSWDGKPLREARRCMVQARQIFSFHTALALGVVAPEPAREAIRSSLRLLQEEFTLPSGGFRHQIDENDAPLDDTPGLYGQAFALFGLAEGYRLFQSPPLKDRALASLAYLHRERRAEGGGFTEFEKNRIVYRSNPHMHLLEAALAWMEADEDPRWRALADELVHLCDRKFVDSHSGLLGENFLPGWVPERDGAGLFHWEPGHHCEWAWLLGRYQKHAARDLRSLRLRLFEAAEAHGRDPQRRGALIDQVSSDLKPRLLSARFWPQTERVKAAAQLGRAESAHEGMRALGRYLETPTPGLWFDTWEADGRLDPRPVKASSLYHIIGAIAEYQKV